MIAFRRAKQTINMTAPEGWAQIMEVGVATSDQKFNRNRDRGSSAPAPANVALPRVPESPRAEPLGEKRRLLAKRMEEELTGDRGTVRAVDNMAVKITEFFKTKDPQTGELVVSGVRGEDVLTGEIRNIALMTASKAAEILPFAPNERKQFPAQSFEERRDRLGEMFAKRRYLGDLAVGSVVGFETVFQEAEKRTFQARWPTVIARPGGDEVALAGLTQVVEIPQVEDPGRLREGRAFNNSFLRIGTLDLDKAVPLMPDRMHEVIELFNPLSEGRINNRQFLVAIEAADGDVQGYSLDQIFLKAPLDGKSVDPIRELAREVFEVDGETNEARLDPSRHLKASQRIMQAMVYDQKHSLMNAAAAAVIIGTLSRRSVDEAFSNLSFRDEMPEDRLKDVRRLMEEARSGELRAAIVPGFSLRAHKSVEERFLGHQPGRKLLGRPFFNGVVGVSNAYEKDGQRFSLSVPRVHALMPQQSQRPERLNLPDIAARVIADLDVRDPEFAARKQSDAGQHAGSTMEA